MAKLLLLIMYKLRVWGRENVPTTGGIVVSNHVTYMDVVFLSIALKRKIRFIASDTLHKTNKMRWLLKLSRAELISPAKTKKSFQANVDFLKKGGFLGIFPEGQVSRTGNLMALREGVDTFAHASGAPVIPVFMDNLWQTVFSFFRTVHYSRKPKKLRREIGICIGKPMPAKMVTLPRIRQALMDLGERGFSKRNSLKSHIAYESLKGLARKPFFEHLIDYSAGRKSMKSGILLAMGLIFSKYVKKSIKAKRVGVVLPPGVGVSIVNLGLVFAGKIPVNLNFTAGPAAIKSCYAKGKIDSVITAEAVKDKFPDFHWPEHVIDVVGVLMSVKKLSVIAKLIQIVLLPSGWLARFYRIPRKGDHDEAGLLFTSGSSGEPKGVPLSHRNILSNIAQIDEVALLSKTNTCLMCCLPIFHSFGFTVTLWYPIIRNVRMVSVPSPLETKKIANAIKAEKVTVFIGTRTFFKPYIRRVEADLMASLELVVAGAEKVTPEFFDVWKNKFGSDIFEGYGLTETTPVASVNLKNPIINDTETFPQTAYRRGSVGRLVPGISARIRDPETGDLRSLFEPGMLYLKGGNIFSGYLEAPEVSAKVLKTGWFETGDIARFDEDGFLYIEGRQSRFSKIGGEMVPHGTVEDKIVELFDLKEEEVTTITVSARFDDSKGEALVLLTTIDIDADEMRQNLMSQGLPNLWVPRIVKKVKEIPVLASGKLDLKGCSAMAAED